MNEKKKKIKCGEGNNMQRESWCGALCSSIMNFEKMYSVICME